MLNSPGTDSQRRRLVDWLSWISRALVLRLGLGGVSVGFSLWISHGVPTDQTASTTAQSPARHDSLSFRFPRSSTVRFR